MLGTVIVRVDFNGVLPEVGENVSVANVLAPCIERVTECAFILFVEVTVTVTVFDAPCATFIVGLSMDTLSSSCTMSWVDPEEAEYVSPVGQVSPA